MYPKKLKKTNDKFRGMEGSFDKAVEGILNCLKVRIKVGLRFTINKFNILEIPEIFNFLEKHNIT